MGKKSVTGTVPKHKVDPGNKGVEFSVYDGDKRMGRLRVHTARVVWIAKDKKYGKQLAWESLQALFAEHGVDENDA